MPESAGQRLRWMCGPGPRKYLGQNPGDDLVLVFRLSVEIRAVVAVVGLIPEIPGEDAWVVGEGTYDALSVILKLRILGRVSKNLRAGSLNPAGVVHTRPGWMLRPELWVWIPAGIEQHEHGPDVMTRRNRQKPVDALLKALWILLPQKVVQEYAHGVHADGLGPP